MLENSLPTPWASNLIFPTCEGSRLSELRSVRRKTNHRHAFVRVLTNAALEMPSGWGQSVFMKCTLGCLIGLTLMFPPACGSNERTGPQTLRVLAYNIRHGAGMDDALDLRRAAAVINALRPDVVTLQEVDSGVHRTEGADQAALLADWTGTEAVFGDFMPYQGGRYGMAILSRLPVLDSTNHRLPPGAEPRSALAATLQVGDIEVIVVGIHLYRSEEERLAQARRLVGIFESEERPVILAGDFNSTPDSTVMQFLEQQWTIAAKTGNPLTFPADRPDREIDFILFRPAGRFEVVESRVIDEPVASDHRPVLLELRVLR